MRIFRSTTSDQNANTYVGPFGEIVVGDNGTLLIQNNVTPGGTALNIEPATPSVLGGVKLGEGFVLNASNQVTTSKLYSTNLTQPTQHYRLELDTNGVVILPDQSIINGSTLRAVAGSYAGLTTNDGENSWMWVDSGGAYIATEYSTTANQWTFDNNGNLTLPTGGTINFADGSNALVGGGGVADTGNITFTDTTIGTVAVNSNVNIGTVYQYTNTNQAIFLDFNIDPGTQSVSMDPGITIDTSAFTISFWIFRRTVSEWTPLFSYLQGNSQSPFIYFNNNNQLVADPYYFDLPFTMNAGQWYYVAICRDSDGNLNMWLNNEPAGPAVANAVLTAQSSGPITELAYLWYGPAYAQAAISSVQVVIGSNIYATSGNISVPTDVPVVIPGTELLLSTSYNGFYAFSDASNTQIITNNSSTPYYNGAPVNNVEIVSNMLEWQFSPGSEGYPQLVVPPYATITAPAGQIGIYGSEGVYINAGSEGRIELNVNTAQGLYGPEYGGDITLNAGDAANGGGGGDINFNAGNGSGNVITQQGSEGGSVWMYGGRGAVYVETEAITAISLATPVTLTVLDNNVQYGGKIYIQNLTTATELNNASYYVIPTGGGNLQLFRDQWLQIPVVGTGISQYYYGNVTTLSVTPINTNVINYKGFLDISPSSNVLVSSLGYNMTVNSANLAAQGGYNVSTSQPLQPSSGDLSTDLYFNLGNWLGGSLQFNSGSNRWLSLNPGVTFSTSAWTVSTWFQLYTTTSGTILGGTNANSLKINIVSDTQIAVGPSGGSPTVFTVPTMGSGTWIWLAVNSDADGVTMWFNGVAATGSPGPDVNYTTATNGIGYTAFSGPDYFDGRLQGMQITNGTALYSSLDSTIPVPTFYTDPTQGSFSLLLNAFQGNATVDSSGTQTITNFNNVNWYNDSPVLAWAPDVDWVFTIPAAGTISSSTDGGGVWLYGGDPSNPSYGSEGHVYVQSNLNVNSVEPFYYNSDLLLKNQNSYYNFNNQSTISSPGSTQYTPYDINPSNPGIYWTSSSPFSSQVTSNGSINSQYNMRTNLQPPMPAIRQSAYTISLWFYPRESGGNNPLLGGENGSLNLISQNLNNLIITTGNPTTATGFAFPSQLNTNQWYYLVVTRDDQHRCAAWLNGVYLVNGNAGYNDGIDINDYTNPIVYLNAGPYGSAFDGVITDVKIDNVNLYSTLGSNIPVPAAPAMPGYSTQLLLSATDSDNVFVNSANTVVYTPFTIASDGTKLGISSDGSIHLPGTKFGNISVSGTVTTVGGLYPAVALPSENVYIWYASSPDVRGFKMTVRAQHNDPCTCLEMADITCAYDTIGGLVYSVGNRIKTNPGAADTAFGVVVDDGITPDQLLLAVNATVSTDTVYFTYEVTEFMTSHAT